MKNSIVPLILMLSLFACKKEAKENHPESHRATISFMVSDGSNLGSFNVYRNDDIIAQIIASTSDNFEYSFVDEEVISNHPYDIHYSVEPMFMDSVANTSISIQISIDDKKVAESNDASVLFGEVVSLSYFGE
ncbi:MAG: hypothetical protein COA58_12450 [Bacteroidetes bacterium]|nr:MAG: hypothetical protein COA58_12450 [Bacteroidota bacterium]